METKICTKCGKELPLVDFNWRDKKAGTRRSECKYCHSNQMKQRYQEKKAEIESLKAQCSCAKCGDKRGYVLEYHHINADDKELSIARLLSNRSSLNEVYQEIEKCIVLCANCHREFHYLERHKNLNLIQYLSGDV